MRDYAPYRAAVGHYQDVAAFVRGGDFFKGRHRAALHLLEALAAGRRGARELDAAALVYLAKLVAHLVVRASVPVAQVHLAQLRHGRSRHSGDGERGRLDGARHAARVERVEGYPSAQMPAERRRCGAPLRREREVRPPVINAAPERELRLRVAHEIYTFALSHFIGSFCRFVFYDEPIVSFRCGIFVRRKLRRSAGPRFAVSMRFSLCGAPRRFAPLSGAKLDAFVPRLELAVHGDGEYFEYR